jgi:hypothetical protein
LHERSGLGIHGRAEKIVGCRVTDVQLDGGIEGNEFDEVRLSEVAVFDGRSRCEGFATKFFDGTHGSDAKDLRRLGKESGGEREDEKDAAKHRERLTQSRKEFAKDVQIITDKVRTRTRQERGNDSKVSYLL